MRPDGHIPNSSVTGEADMTRDQLQILENQLVANCQYQGTQPTLHKLLESLYAGKNLDAILKELLE
jgi:hypothetical protein